MVRDANTAMDRGEFRAGDRAPFLDTLERWDRIFCVLEDNDREKLVKLGFIKPGDTNVATPSVRVTQVAVLVAVRLPTDEEIGRLIAERDEMRRKGNYARADEIRQNLQKADIILEDSKVGTRWKRK